MSSKTSDPIMINGEVVEEVDYFTYLGSKVSTSRDGEEEILVRISRTLAHFEALGDPTISAIRKDPVLQRQCLKTSTVWHRILEDDLNHQPQARSLPEQVPVQDSPYILVSNNLKL